MKEQRIIENLTPTADTRERHPHRRPPLRPRGTSTRPKEECPSASAGAPYRHAALEIAQRQIPMPPMTGDLLWHKASEHGLTLLIADVPEKGEAAGERVKELCQVIETRGPGDPTSSLLPMLNGYLLDRGTDEDSFVSALLIAIDPRAQQLTLHSAGHPPPLLVGRGEPEWLDAPGLLLGLSPDVSYKALIRPFYPGDTLVLYTDAATEARSPAGHRVGEDGLKDLVARHHDLSPKELIAALLREIYASYRVADDLTLCMVRHR
jgi:sigma-B regulation protein RsbU (phosphoserine phosphatase)